MRFHSKANPAPIVHFRSREAVIAKFKVEPDGFSDAPIGPHPISQFNVMFETPEFQNGGPWLMLNPPGSTSWSIP